MIQCKRVYETPSTDDGYRVLVDRLWPRGVKKESLACNEWCKALAPSTQLRKDFHAGVIDFTTFRQRYCQQLAEHKAEGLLLAALSKQQRVTLLFAAKDAQQNHALVLADWLNAL